VIQEQKKTNNPGNWHTASRYIHRRFLWHELKLTTYRRGILSHRIRLRGLLSGGLCSGGLMSVSRILRLNYWVDILEILRDSIGTVECWQWTCTLYFVAQNRLV